eukprot:CAMPEP_0182816944 /NCGR_PEP_ID=MMETSP0006_2-20121128/11206_1 /TAXON_ID=97485 /ORGANISM="Prymnesium parvum, Strain Texoma1" /LENGTH=127 /DNA_ID=CAMNT_0024943267 /DNA_START=269 /DNA_END=652 /DNA_ORIENTATION=-
MANKWFICNQAQLDEDSRSQTTWTKLLRLIQTLQRRPDDCQPALQHCVVLSLGSFLQPTHVVRSPCLMEHQTKSLRGRRDPPAPRRAAEDEKLHRRRRRKRFGDCFAPPEACGPRGGSDGPFGANGG